MTQADDQATQTEQRTQETRSFLRQLRAATRRKYTPEEKIRIVLEGFRRETTVNELWLKWSGMVEGRTGDSGSLAFPGARIILVEAEAQAR